MKGEGYQLPAISYQLLDSEGLTAGGVTCPEQRLRSERVRCPRLIADS